MKVKNLFLTMSFLTVYFLITALPAFCADRPVLVETFSEDFSQFNVDRPYRWSRSGDPDALIVDKAQGYIGLQGISNGVWTSPLTGKGGWMTQDINYSIYHHVNPERFPKTYALTLRLRSENAGNDQRYVVRLEWFDDKEAVIESSEFPFEKSIPDWKEFSSNGDVPKAAVAYRFTVSGQGTPDTNSWFHLDDLKMKIFIEDLPFEFPSDNKLREMKLSYPLNAREFHYWWHTPWHPEDWPEMYKLDPDLETPFSSLWDKSAWYVKRDFWQRAIDSRQYPLIGPYDAFDKEVMRWQVESMRNTGLEGTFIQMWPNSYDNNMKYGSMEVIWDRMFNIAEEQGYKIALHDENWSDDLIADAARLVQFLKRYIHREGYYHINGQPAVAFQNWNNYFPYTPEQLEKLLSYVEEQLDTDIYWIVSIIRFNFPIQERYKKFLAIEKLDCIDFRYAVEEISRNHETGEISWWAMNEGLKSFIEFLKSSPVKHDWSASVSPGFDSVIDYTRIPAVLYDGYIMPYQRRNQGLMFLKELYILSNQEIAPKFITIKSWNDYHEGHAIEPGYYYEGDKSAPFGLNQDPYFYTKLVAGLVGKEFSPARLPAPEHVDPLVRPRLYKEYESKDVYGPLFTGMKFEGDVFRCQIEDYNTDKCILFQDIKPAAGIRVSDSGEFILWGLELLTPGSAGETAGRRCLKISSGDTIRVKLNDSLAGRLGPEDRVFLLASYYDLKSSSNERQYAVLQLNYTNDDHQVVHDRRIRIYNNADWQWGLQCLYNADMKSSSVIDIRSQGSDLSIRSLYLVIPGLAAESRELEPESAGKYSIRFTPDGESLSADRVAVLYPQDTNGNYGNLIIVDTENQRVFPDIESVVEK